MTIVYRTYESEFVGVGWISKECSVIFRGTTIVGWGMCFINEARFEELVGFILAKSYTVGGNRRPGARRGLNRALDEERSESISSSFEERGRTGHYRPNNNQNLM